MRYDTQGDFGTGSIEMPDHIQVAEIIIFLSVFAAVTIDKPIQLCNAI
jgi:hypothetical protein